MASDLLMLGVSAGVVLWCAGLVSYAIVVEGHEGRLLLDRLAETFSIMLVAAGEERRRKERDLRP